MSENISVKKISEYRASLMGLAILAIMVCHNTLYFQGAYMGANDRLKILSQCGVDIFFFLSGMGCFISLCSNSTGKFYFKRFLKIMCPYLMVVVCYGFFRIVVCADDVFQFIGKYCLITFFTKGELEEWFIAGILATYLLAPLFYKLINEHAKLFAVLVCAVYVLCFSHLWLAASPFRTVIEIWVSRLPSYMFGMLLGRTVRAGKGVLTSLTKRIVIANGIFSFALTIAFYYLGAPSFWVFFRLMCLPILLCTITLYILIMEKAGKNIVNMALEYLGSLTLEIYLLHEKLLRICDSIINRLNIHSTFGSIISNVVAVALALIFAKILHNLLEVLIEKLLGAYSTDAERRRIFNAKWTIASVKPRRNV